MLKDTIGNTPMIKIKCKYKGKEINVFSKLEYYNLTGSIKDRVAYYMIKEAAKTGELKEYQPIVETTSGNTGISLSAIGAYYKHPVFIFMPDWVSKERIQLMENYEDINIYGKKADKDIKNDFGFSLKDISNYILADINFAEVFYIEALRYFLYCTNSHYYTHLFSRRLQ